MEDRIVFQAEVVGWTQQKSKQMKITLHADERYRSVIADMFPVGAQVAVAAIIDPETGEVGSGA